MKTHTTPVWLLAVILAWGALAAGETQAASISRCAAADGVVTYTDGRCSEMGALPAPMPLDLVRRLAHTGGFGSEEAGPAAFGDAFERAGADFANGSGRAPAFAGCPRTVQQLQFAFEQSLASGDVNRLAAIYDWTNVSGQQSRDLLQRLERMSRSRAQDADVYGSVRRRAGCLLLSL